MSDNFNKADSNFQKSESSKLHMHSNFPFDSAEGKKFVENTQPSDVFSEEKIFEATTEFWMEEFPDFFHQLSQYIDACAKSGYSRARFLTERHVFASAAQHARGKLLQGQLNNFHDFFQRYIRRNDFSINYEGKSLVWRFSYDGRHTNIDNIPCRFNVQISGNGRLPSNNVFREVNRGRSNPYHPNIRYGVELKSENQLSEHKQFEINIPDNVPFFRLTNNLKPIRELVSITISWGNVIE